MARFEFYALKDMLEDFYIQEIAHRFSVATDLVDYHDNKIIKINGQEFETLLSVSGISKKDIFRAAENRVLNYLKTFMCERNVDVQEFLHDDNKCLRMHKESRTRTFFLIDMESQKRAIAAYFSIAFKPIILVDSNNLRGKKKKAILNIPNKDGCGDLEIVPTILIGQIGRSDGYQKSEIGLKLILEYVFGVIDLVREYIGGRVILVEVDKEPKLIRLYEEHGFERIQESNGLSQLMQFVSSY